MSNHDCDLSKFVCAPSIKFILSRMGRKG